MVEIQYSGKEERRWRSMIETSGLTKRFDDILAVDHISAKIRDGSVFGLIGTNGAGKSTFLRMVSGIETDEREQC